MKKIIYPIIALMFVLLGYFAIFGTPKIESKPKKVVKNRDQNITKDDKPLKKLDEEIKRLENKGKSKEVTQEIIKPILQKIKQEQKPFIPRVNKVNDVQDTTDISSKDTKSIKSIKVDDVDIKFDEVKFDEFRFDTIEVK
jgi:uncharacterized membrane protein YvbJ